MADSMGTWTVPQYSASNLPYDSQYFWVHHSQADTIERMDPRQLNHVAAASAIWAYSIASLPELLPRDAAAPPASHAAAAGSSSFTIGAIAGGSIAAAGVAGFIFYRNRASAAGALAGPAYSALGVSAATAEPSFA